MQDEPIQKRGNRSFIKNEDRNEIKIEHLENLLIYLQDALAILDANGIIKYVTPSINKLLQYQSKDLVGTESFLLLEDGSITRSKSKFLHILKHPNLKVGGLLQFLSKNGERISINVQAHNLFHDPWVNGVLLFLQASKTHITSQFNNVTSHLSTDELYDEARKEVQLQLAAELHDHIKPSLGAIKLLLNFTLKDPQKHVNLINESCEIVNTLIHDIRNLSSSLTIERHDKLNLLTALTVLFNRFRKVNGLRIVLKYDRKLDDLLKDEQKFHLLRLVQEQLINIEKHAGATKAVISLQNFQGTVFLNTKDNGNGFEVTAKRSGIGITNMYYRTNQLNGNIHVNSKVGTGTWIQIHFPL